jgi:hypothetical protein
MEDFMPFVGCPKNSDVVSSSISAISSFKTYRRDGSVAASGSQVTAPYSLSRASKHGVGGKMVLVNNKPWSPTRPYTRSASLVEYEPGTTYLKAIDTSGQTQIWQGYCAPSSIWSPTDGLLLAAPSGDFSVDSFGVPTLSAKSMARINTGLLVKAGDRKVNIGNFLAESKETLKMLATAVQRFARIYRSARNGRWSDVLRLLGTPKLNYLRGVSHKGKTVSEIWLEFIYGWKPLLADIYDLFNTLQKGLNIKPQMLSVRRRISTSDVIDEKGISTFHRYCRTNGTLYGKMWYKISSSDITFWNRLGLINPAEPLWEALPFSFIVDWFVPVSSYLEALSARVGLDFVDGYYGCKQETICILSQPTKASSGYVALSSSCRSTRTTVGYRRTKMSSLPWPDVWFKSPFSTIHVANAIALLAGMKKH